MAQPAGTTGTDLPLSSDEAVNYVLRSAHEHDVKFIRLWFTDILGTLKGFAITVDDLEEVLVNGASFDGASIEGLARADEADMVAVPDPTTWQILPWRPKANAVARMFCDVRTPDGRAAAACSREVLRRNMRHAADMGFTFYVAPEIEYFYLNGPDSPETFDRGGYFDQTAADGAGPDLRRDTVLALEEMSIPVKHSHHEVARGQHEIVLRHTGALTMADSVITFRVVAKEIAAQRGVYASFMPKPFNDRHGSGMHTHMSLFRGDANAFHDPADEMKLSQTGKQFIAGLIRHAAEITAITNPWVNSYKRLVPGFEAPVLASWTSRSWGDLIRVPAYRTGREAGVRVEYRSPDASCNPYLAFSVMLAAGLEGIEQGYPLPERIEGNLEAMSEEELAKRGVSRLPSTLDEAVRVAEKSALLKRALGPAVLESYLNNKRIEWRDYSRAVTDYEIARYLPQL
ncbi:MAG: glutamine synthetase [Dehalococcoidia bacterium]|nr:glutamine synthetase [Dehalococcoidia bacterium]